MSEYPDPPPLSPEQELALYDSDKTPDIIFGLLLLRLNTSRIAEILGVSLETLHHWLANEPQLAEVNDRVIRADADVLSALHKAACGHTAGSGDSAKYYPPNVRAIETWIKHRKVGEGAEGEATERVSSMSDEDRRKLAKEVVAEIKHGIPQSIKSRG